MKPIGQSVKLGLIVCQYCGRWIDEVETEKVTVLYGCCREETCSNGSRQGEAEND
ncbi:GapA-binding peptide SR1P [Paenibacillus hodogayensis]|uniref:GapA-binding peptide SR1P n=1 Tax=Paenibacillus hodogayensis TaxID=279208 RepID=A0ABV5W5Y0_9BACL